jgi:hypothetical protein
MEDENDEMDQSESSSSSRQSNSSPKSEPNQKVWEENISTKGNQMDFSLLQHTEHQGNQIHKG